MDRLSHITKQRLTAQQMAAEAEHPSADTLVAFTEQGLQGTQRQRVLSHLAVCPECRQAVSLAISAEQVSPVAIPSRSHGLRFPMAMRWASAAAALAVAIGIGVLSSEHQNRPSPRASAPPQTKEKSVMPAAQPGIEQNSQIAKTEAKAEAETKAANSRRASQPRVMADASARRAETRLHKTQSGTVLGGLVAGAHPTTVPPPNVADGFISDAAPPPPPPSASPDKKASTFSDVAAAPSGLAGGVFAPSTSSQPVRAARSNAQLEEESQAGRVESSTFNGPARASLQQRPTSSAEMKAVASSAIGGPVRSGAIHGFAPIAHWSVSSNGKLQRQSGDGRFTLVEPAPGVSIRTVAAQGIEVWAAGSRPDLSAQQWQQRPVLFHSSDAGETWMQIAGPWQSPITALTLSGTNTLTVISADGSWKTDDAGKSWTKK